MIKIGLQEYFTEQQIKRFIHKFGGTDGINYGDANDLGLACKICGNDYLAHYFTKCPQFTSVHKPKPKTKQNNTKQKHYFL